MRNLVKLVLEMFKGCLIRRQYNLDGNCRYQFFYSAGSFSAAATKQSEEVMRCDLTLTMLAILTDCFAIECEYDDKLVLLLLIN